MGKLVPFEMRRQPSRIKATDTDRGQILIFTGVRYERGIKPLPSDGTPPARRKRKRG